jgi:ABC-type sugar transport system ATPase subunit
LQHLPGSFCAIDGDIWQDQAIFLQPYERPIGYVFQEASLFQHLSVRRNLLYGAPRGEAHSGAGSVPFDEVIDLLCIASPDHPASHVDVKLVIEDYAQEQIKLIESDATGAKKEVSSRFRCRPRTGLERNLLKDFEIVTLRGAVLPATTVCRMRQGLFVVTTEIAHSDIRQARALASLICSSESAIDAYLMFALAEAKALIVRHRAAVLAIARALMVHRTLDAVMIYDIIARAPERARRADWTCVERNAAEFAARGFEG